jgi:hypothetical protein
MTTHAREKVEGAKVGRPKKEINYDEVRKLAEMWCTQEEIANYLDCSLSRLTKDEEFIRVYKKGLSVGRMSLRRTQVQSAIKGNVSMQIWLGKQYLGQRDTVEVTDERLNKIDTLIESIDNVAKR